MKVEYDQQILFLSGDEVGSSKELTLIVEAETEGFMLVAVSPLFYWTPDCRWRGNQYYFRRTRVTI